MEQPLVENGRCRVGEHLHFNRTDFYVAPHSVTSSGCRHRLIHRGIPPGHRRGQDILAGAGLDDVLAQRGVVDALRRDGQSLGLRLHGVFLRGSGDLRTGAGAVVQAVQRVPLVALELEHECEVNSLRVVVLDQDTLRILVLVENRLLELLRHECQLKIAGVAGVPVCDIVGDIIRIEDVLLALGIQRDAHRTGDRERSSVGSGSIRGNRGDSCIALGDAVLDLVIRVRHLILPPLL